MTKAESVLHASRGDRIVIRGHHVGEISRDAEILDVLGPNGTPPYVVRWEDNGRVSRLYPGSDAFVQHFEHDRDVPAHRRPPRPNPAADSLPSAADWEAAVPPRDS